MYTYHITKRLSGIFKVTRKPGAPTSTTGASYPETAYAVNLEFIRDGRADKGIFVISPETYEFICMCGLNSKGYIAGIYTISDTPAPTATRDMVISAMKSGQLGYEDSPMKYPID